MRSDDEARALVEENLGLVKMNAGRWERKLRGRLKFEEILGLCWEGAFKASRLWDPEQSRYSTYTVRSMDNHVGAELKKQWRRRGGDTQRKPWGPLTAHYSIEWSTDEIAGEAPATGITLAIRERLGTEAEYDLIDLADAVRRLPDRVREVVALRAHGYSWDEIAEQFGVTRQAVQKASKEGIESLKKQFRRA